MAPPRRSSAVCGGSPRVSGARQEWAGETRLGQSLPRLTMGASRLDQRTDASALLTLTQSCAVSRFE